jgi:RimJ/RimL family protein N-acetyltransferase
VSSGKDVMGVPDILPSVTMLIWPVEAPTLTDGPVTLRKWITQDADAVYTACQDAEIQRFMDVPVPFLLEHAIQFVGEQCNEQWQSQKGAPFAITRTDDDRVIGSCGIFNVDAENLVAAVVYAVAPAFRGGGVAQRAAGILCEWAFREVGMVRLEFHIESDNESSRSVAKRLGCQYEGPQQNKKEFGGRVRDWVVYSLVK